MYGPFNEKNTILINLLQNGDNFEIYRTEWLKASPEEKRSKKFKTLQEATDFLNSNEAINFVGVVW
jgi:hypothetical protein